MKRRSQLAHWRKLPLVALRQEVERLMVEVQDQTALIRFGKSQQVRTTRAARRGLARVLTIARERLPRPGGERP